MTIPPRDSLLVRIRSIQSAIERNRSHRDDNVSMALAGNFNVLLMEAAVAYPDIAAALPQAISLRSVFSEAGLTDARLVDLDAFCDQILGLLSLAEGEGK